MTWTRISNWAEIADGHPYSVSAAKCAQGYAFQAWRRDTPATLLGTFWGKDAATLARRACEDDAQVVA